MLQLLATVNFVEGFVINTNILYSSAKVYYRSDFITYSKYFIENVHQKILETAADSPNVPPLH